MPRHITLVQQFEQQQAATWALAFSQDGTQLVSSDEQALSYFWKLDAHGHWKYERSTSQNISFPFSAPDGRMLAFIYEEEQVRLISLDGSEGATLPRPFSGGWTPSPDLRWALSNGRGRSILLWDFALNQRGSMPIPFPADHRDGMDTDPSHGGIGRFLFTPDSHRIVLWADSPEGSLHICSFDPEQKGITLQKTLPHGMIDGTISPNGKMLATIVPNDQIWDHKEEVYVYSLESLRLLHVFPQTAKEPYNLLAFSPDSQYLASCKTDGWVDIFSLNAFDCIAQFAAHPGLSSHATEPIGGLAWSKTSYIATGGASVFEKDMEKTDYTVRIWKVEE